MDSGRAAAGIRSALPLVFALSLVACAGAQQHELRLKTVASGLDRPLYATAPAGDPRLFVVEQGGTVRILSGGALLPVPFMDISDRISSGGERGLLSIAFHPDYASNGYVYVDYTDVNGDTRVSRFTISANPDVVDVATEKLILFVDQPYSNHNGGLVMFGQDGMLYIGMGDGGSGGDPLGHGQNRATLLGDLLRIDVDNGDPYAIPPDNPFVGISGLKEEIWAWGLRNPWRFAFDHVGGLLYIADVGQGAWEEVNIASSTAAGLNYGWRVMEGRHCYGGGSCSSSGLTLPGVEYSHSEGCSVTGGFVYRGSAVPEMDGQYFYADYCSGWIRSFRWRAGKAVDERQWKTPDIGRILSFGEDASGELYVLTDSGGVYRIIGTG